MTSKDALEKICKDWGCSMAHAYKRCPWRGIPGEYCEEYETIKKDLEVLEIFRNNEISISYLEESKSYDDYISKCDYFRCLTYITEEKYNKLKEWLKNETSETENRD